jgi:hypothetical protein
LERRGFGADEIRSLREAYRLLCRANLNVKQACETIRTDLPSERSSTISLLSSKPAAWNRGGRWVSSSTESGYLRSHNAAIVRRPDKAHSEQSKEPALRQPPFFSC